MESFEQQFNQLVQLLESLQKNGRFALGEAHAIFLVLIAMKKHIDSGAVSSATSSDTSPSNEEIESLKLELITTRIELDNTKRSLEDAEEKLAEFENSS